MTNKQKKIFIGFLEQCKKDNKTLKLRDDFICLNENDFNLAASYYNGAIDNIIFDVKNYKKTRKLAQKYNNNTILNLI